MNKKTEQPQGTRSRAIASSEPKTDASEPESWLIDNRPESDGQKTLQQVAKQSSGASIASQLKKVGSNSIYGPVKSKFETGPAEEVSQKIVQKESRPGTVIQRQAITVAITGTTHLVEMVGSSIMEGNQGRLVGSGDVLKIDTSKKYRSRRGPNQEVYREVDLEGDHEYRWFLVTSINGAPAPENSYVRDETFTTDVPEALGSRPAKIGDSQRDRISPDQLTEHTLAANILQAANNLPEQGEVDAAVGEFMAEKDTAHDPLKTVRFMKICYALGTSVEALGLAGTEDATDRETLEKTIAILESVSRQIVQAWDAGPVADLEQRTVAWIQFKTGIDSIADKEQRFHYIQSCLVHDKGYAQTYEAAVKHLQYGAVPEAEEESFATILARALDDTTNMNIWTGSMRNASYREQLSNPGFADLTEAYERRMWGMLLAPIMNSKFPLGPTTENWMTYPETILENSAAIFTAVSGLVPGDFALHQSYIADEMTI